MIAKTALLLLTLWAGPVRPAAVAEQNWVELCADKLPWWFTLHEYHFSDTELNWVEARAECEMYGDGSYLVAIENRLENNCLLEHAMEIGEHGWWWHSGEEHSIYSTILIISVRQRY